MSSRMSYKWNIIQHKLFSVNLISFHMFLRFISVDCIKNSFLFENLINCFFPLHWVFGAAHGLSLAAVRQGCSSLWCAVSSLRWLLLLRSSSSRVQVQQLWCTGLAAPWSERSSQTRDWTCVPCIGRWILNHWITREVPTIPFFSWVIFRCMTILQLWFCGFILFPFNYIWSLFWCTMSGKDLL